MFLIGILMHYNLFPIVIRLKKNAIKLSVLKLLPYNLFQNTMSEKLRDKATDTCPAVFVPISDQYMILKLF